MEITVEEVKSYIADAAENNKIKNAEYVTAGFVDGDLEVVYSK